MSTFISHSYCVSLFYWAHYPYDSFLFRNPTTPSSLTSWVILLFLQTPFVFFWKSSAYGLVHNSNCRVPVYHHKCSQYKCVICERRVSWGSLTDAQSKISSLYFWNVKRFVDCLLREHKQIFTHFIETGICNDIYHI